MAATLKFGPEWLRQLSGGNSMTSPPPSPSFGGKYKLADYRYGREEMLALFTPNAKAPDDLRTFQSVLVERCQDPMAMIPPTDEEQRLLASSVNSNAAFRQVAGRGADRGGPPGMRGARGGMSARGRGRGRGDSGGFFQRGFDDGSTHRSMDGYRGRGREGGPTKIIERDSSGFLSARSFDDSTRPAGKDPFSRSMPGDSWREMRGGRAMEADESGGRGSHTQNDDGDWRRAGKDRHPRGNWRDAKTFDDDSHYQRSYHRSSSYTERRPYRNEPDDELPEWATDDCGGGDEGGTFDASGAFMSLKEFEKPRTNGQAGNRKAEKSDNSKPDEPTIEETPESPDEKKKTPDGKETDQPNASPVKCQDDSEPTNALQSQSNNTTTSPSKSVQEPKSEVHESPRQEEKRERSVEPEADFDHLAKAAEEMMATWAAEDEAKAPDSPDPSDPTRSPELADSWFYRDPQGTLQGPFTAQEMAEWFSAGYFTMNLNVKQGRDREFQPLGELIKRNNGQQPFMPTQSSLNVRPVVNASAQDHHALQQVYLLQQQALIQQQQQQALLLRQQAQLQQVVQTLQSTEEYSKLTPAQLQVVAMQILVKENQKQALLAQQQQLLDQQLSIQQQNSPPQVNQIISQDEENLWGVMNRSWNQQLREQLAVEEIAQKEAARNQLRERQERERQERERLARREEEQRRQEEKEELMRQQAEREAAQQREYERQQQELEKQRLIKIEKQRAAELERQKHLDQLRELEKQQEMARAMEEERQRQHEMKRQRELERKAEQEAEAARRQEAQRQQQELERQQAEAAERERQEKEKAERERQQAIEREQLQAIQLPSHAQWGSSNHNLTATQQQQLNLQEIQRKEQEKAEKERLARQANEARMKAQQAQQADQSQLKWAASQLASVSTGKSLREIQEEEARRLSEEHARQKAAALPHTAPSATWGVKAAGWASEGAWGGGKKVSGGWEQPATRSVKQTNNDVFPSLGAAPAKQQQQPKPNNAQPKKKSASSQKKEEERVQQLFQSATQTQNPNDQFIKWCTKSLNGLNDSIDVPTFISFLRDVESPYEVQDYVKQYLGESAKSAQFAKEFLEKRSTINKQKQARHDEESLWGPAPAVNPGAQRQTSEQPASSQPNKRKGKKSGKSQKLDATALLGFNVSAASNRFNIGEIERTGEH